jgi:hypothetical protein
MSEELEVSKTETVEVQETSPKGYLNYEEFIAKGGDPRYFKGDKAYEKDGELIKYVQHQNKTVAELKKTVENLNSHLTKVEEVTKQKTISEMKQQLYDASQMADSSKVMDLHDKISKAEKDSFVPQSNTVELLKQFGAAFKSENPDICSDPDMFDYARKTEQMLLSTRPDIPVSELYNHVKEKVHEKFKPVQKSNINAVYDAGNGETTKNFGSNKKDGYEGLSPFFKQQHNRLKQQLGDKFNSKQFIDQSLQVQAVEGDNS